MKIGLIDVDSHNFPNLALMKLSAYHKGRGDSVFWWNGFEQYDRVYKSRVFTDLYSEDIDYCINADEVIKGGTGYDLKNKLPDEIEHYYPDYELYNIKDKAFGFLTRGCPRSCPFCIVSEKEGNTHTVADLSEFWRGQKEIILMDSNITASKDCERLFEDLIKSRALINFEGGLDVRLLTDKGAEQLNRMRTSMIHFAWD
ncbi:MAG: radical SAM protein, partial [Oscillospiraceae bacterium]|nr:radical SAM protein [Oscillospiraceae bacterium]